MPRDDPRRARWATAPAIVSSAALLVCSLLSMGCPRQHEPVTRTVLDAFPGKYFAAPRRAETLLVCFVPPAGQHITEQVGLVLTNRYYTGAKLRPLLIQGLVREFGNVREADDPSQVSVPADYVVVISELSSAVRPTPMDVDGVVDLHCEVRGKDGETLGKGWVSACATERVKMFAPPSSFMVDMPEVALGSAVVDCAKQAVGFIARTVDSKGAKK